MSFNLGAITVAALVAACSMAQAAEQTVFKTSQITVQGSTQVSVTAINDKGAYVGAATINGALIGFIQDGTAFTQIEGNCFAAADCRGYPTGINNKGAVVGLAQGGRNSGFVWQNGAFVNGDFFTMPYNQSTAMVGPFISDTGRVAFNLNQGTNLAYAGNPASPKLLGGFGLASANAYVMSINNAGFVAGIGYLPGGNNQFIHFVGKNKSFANLALANSGSLNAFNTLINNKNEVAYAVGPSVSIFANGAYTTVSLPSQAIGTSVQALNTSGRLVGSYLDTGTSTQTIFLYNGTMLSTFGSYPEADQLHISMNDKGTIVIDDIATHNGGSQSFLVRCKGPGC